VLFLLVSVCVFALTNLFEVDRASAQVGPTPTPACAAGTFWDPLLRICRPNKTPCPAGTIDVLSDRDNDDGGDDCQPLDVVPAPLRLNCSPAIELNATGAVVCQADFGPGRLSLPLDSAVGCVAVERTPYPRLIVGLGSRDSRVATKFEAIGVLASVASVAVGTPGYYQPDDRGREWTVRGLYLHERFGGAGSFDVRRTMDGDAYRYPSFNNLRAVLRFQLVEDSARWVLNTRPGFGADRALARGGIGSPVSVDLQHFFRHASYPVNDPETGPVAGNGPDRAGSNTLPAFQLQFQAQWRLLYEATWDNFGVNGANEYVRLGTGGTGGEVELATFWAARAWDPRQRRDGATAAAYCNAATGYIPLPVIEAQSVLVP
jgi:hypothetical protein